MTIKKKRIKKIFGNIFKKKNNNKSNTILMNKCFLFLILITFCSCKEFVSFDYYNDIKCNNNHNNKSSIYLCNERIYEDNITFIACYSYEQEIFILKDNNEVENMNLGCNLIDHNLSVYIDIKKSHFNIEEYIIVLVMIILIILSAIHYAIIKKVNNSSGNDNKNIEEEIFIEVLEKLISYISIVRGEKDKDKDTEEKKYDIIV